MKIEKEKWIDEVLNSAQGKGQVPVNPFLYEKVLFKAQQYTTEDKVADKRFVYKWAAVVILLVGINGVTIINSIAHRHHGTEAHGQTAFAEMETQASYNY